MENKRDIGKAFREKLDQLDRSPNERLWHAIEADLDKKKKRRFLPFWFTFVAVALIAISAVVYQNQTDPVKIDGSDSRTGIGAPNPRASEAFANEGKTNTGNPNNQEANPAVKYENKQSVAAKPNGQNANDANDLNDTDDAKTKKQNTIVKSKNRLNPNTVVNNNSASRLKNEGSAKDKRVAIHHKYKKTGRSTLKKQSKKSDGSKLSPSEVDAAIGQTSDITNESKTTTPDLAAQTQTDASQKTDSLKTVPETKPTPKDPVAERSEPKPSTKDSTKTIELQKISLFVYGAPTTGGFFSKKSALDRRLNSNPKKFEVTLSYGAYALYEATEKWSLRFGLSMMNLRTVTQDAVVNTTDYDYIEYQKNTNVSLYAQSNAKLMDLRQEISYIEVPLELKYVVRSGKFGINAYGGLSVLFLSKNVVSARTSNGMIFELGKTANLSSNSYSLNAGIGIDYKFAKRMRLNVEPVFKYHLLDYKDVGVMPYSIGVLTGLQFSFK